MNPPASPAAAPPEWQEDGPWSRLVRSGQHVGSVFRVGPGHWAWVVWTPEPVTGIGPTTASARFGVELALGTREG